jgi:hypothetical protein
MSEGFIRDYWDKVKSQSPFLIGIQDYDCIAHCVHQVHFLERISFFGHYTWDNPGLFLSFISFSGQSIEIRRYSLLELSSRSLLSASHTVWRVVRRPVSYSWLLDLGVALLGKKTTSVLVLGIHL